MASKQLTNGASRITMQQVAPRWLISRDAARYLGVQPNTLSKWRQRDEGPPYTRKGHKTVFYTIVDLDAFMAQNEKPNG